MDTEYVVAQSYPPPTSADRIIRISTHPSFEEARAAADLDNRGRDNTTAAVCLFQDGSWWKLNAVGGRSKLLIQPGFAKYIDNCICGNSVTQQDIDDGYCPECGRDITDLSTVWAGVEALADMPSQH